MTINRHENTWGNEQVVNNDKITMPNGMIVPLFTPGVPNKNNRVYPHVETDNEVISTNTTFVLLGSGKPSAGVEMTGGVNIRMFVTPHPLNKSVRSEASEIEFNYFDAEGEKHIHKFRVAKLIDSAFDFVGCFDILLDLEIFEGNLEEKATLPGFTDKLQNEFKSRLEHAIRNPKFVQRYSHAASLARWGVL